MADSSIKYVVSADTSGFSAGMQRVAQGLDHLKNLGGGTGATFQNLARSMSQNMAEMGRTLSTEVSGMAGHFGGLLESIGATRAGIVGLVAVGAALAANKVVSATADMTESTMDLARVLGSSTNDAQAWRLALQDVGGSQQELEGAAKGMSRQLKENEDDMRAMGLQTRDAAGNLRPMSELLADGIGILGGYKEGADRALASQALFGRGIDASSRLLLVNNGTLDDARQTMAELGLEVGANAVAAWKDYDAASDRAGFTMRGLGNTIGTILMPVLTDVINVFSGAMPAAITVVRGWVGSLATAWHALANGVVVVGEVIMAVIYTVTEPIRSLGSALLKLAQGDFKAATDEMMGWPSRVGTYWGQAMDNMVASSQQAKARIAALWGGGDSAAGTPEGPQGARNYVAPPKKEKAEKEKSFLPAYEAMLEAERTLATERDAIHGMSKAREVEFWQQILAAAQLTAADELAVSKKLSAARIAMLREEAQQAQSINKTSIDAWQERELSRLALDGEAAKARVAQGELTQAQLLTMEQQFEDRRRDIKLAALQATLANLDPTKDPVQVAAVQAQIEQLEQQHQLRLAQIRTQTIDLNAKEQGRIWEGLSQTVSGLWDKGIQAMMNGTLTWRGALKATMSEMALWFGQTVVGDMVKAWLKGQATKLASVLMGTAAEKSAQKLAAAETITTKVAEAGVVVGANAAEAASGAAASQASIPFAGPFLAAAAFAAIGALVLGAGSMIPSAAGGFDIPAGVNPLTQLHEREMVLPGHIADPMREMLAGGGTMGGDTHLHVHAMDAQSVERLFRNNGAALVSTLKAQRRNLAF